MNDKEKDELMRMIKDERHFSFWALFIGFMLGFIFLLVLISSINERLREQIREFEQYKDFKIKIEALLPER